MDPISHAIVACTPGNQHRVGMLAVADALALAGWHPLVLGSDTPTQDVARMARDRDAGLVALSVGLDAELPTLEGQLRRLRAVVRPGAAAGSVTRSVVCHSRAPRP